MCDSLFNPSELRFLWKHRGDKNYSLKSLISNGTFIQYMVLEDLCNHKKLLGKIVTTPGEGEAYHWPRLQHENLAPLIGTVSINEKLSVYILPLFDNNLRNAIHANKFMNDSECFNRKRAYTEDILWALDYLHNKSLCLMNLTELTIYICDISDKAVICDFSHLFLIERATKEKLDLPALYQAPELKKGYFDPVSIETWACGVMLLQIFTKHYLPSAFIGEEVRQVLQAVKEINYDIIKEANPGAQMDLQIVEELREFLDCFLDEDPKQRINASSAAASPFLCSRRGVTKDDASGQFLKFNSNFEHPWGSYQAIWRDLDYKNRKSETFKDIYLKEIAKCRAKLKKSPCTNKFINLDFVSDGDNISHNTEKYQDSENTKSKDIRMDWIIKNVLIKDEPIHSPELPSVQNSEELVIGDSKTILFENSECMENDSSMEFVNSISINLEQKSNLGVIENVIQNGDKTDNDSFDTQNNEYDIKSLSGTSSSGGDRIKSLDSQSSSKTDMTMHLEDSSENINGKEQMIVQNTFNVSNLTLHDDNYILNKSNSETQGLTAYAKEKRNITRTISEITVRNSNLWIKSVRVKNISNTSFWQSDPGIDCSKATKENPVVSYLNAISSFYIHCNERCSKKITIPDSTTLNANLKDDISSDYSCKSYMIKTSQNEKQTSEAFAPEINCSEFFLTKNCELHKTVGCRKQRDSPKHEVKPNFLTKRELNNNELFEKEKNFEDDETEINPIKKLAHQMEIDYQFIRRNSYRQAVSQGLKNNAPDETNTLTRENLTAGGLASPKNLLSNNITLSSTEEDKVEINHNDKKSGHILPIRSIFTDEGNIQSLQHSTLEFMEDYVLQKSTDLLVKTKRKKRMKRSWIYYLCPGSRQKENS